MFVNDRTIKFNNYNNGYILSMIEKYVNWLLPIIMSIFTMIGKYFNKLLIIQWVKFWLFANYRHGYINYDTVTC